MQTNLPEEFLATDRGQRADQILRSCVHCGFCNATCPTYQLLGDELDGPRGRIYLIKDFLETSGSEARLRQHLDRCLTCRACETTCPSGVQYGALAEVARAELSPSQTGWRRWVAVGMQWALPYRGRLRILTQLGRWVRWALPASLREQLPEPVAVTPAPDPETATQQVILLQGCVQDVSTPRTTAAVQHLLHSRGIQTHIIAEEGCCGSLALHLGDEARAHTAMSANIDALTPYLEDAEAIISGASGCGVTLKDYGLHLGSARAKAFADKVVDVAEYLSQLETPLERSTQHQRVAWHPPCTLQHGQQLTGLVEHLLTQAGYELVPVADAHLCCGSAGTYSILQAPLARSLRENKLEALQAEQPDVIATANVGCQTFLAAAAGVPVVHWTELVR